MPVAPLAWRLERRIPEILGIMMLADGKADVRRLRIAGKGQREGNLHRRCRRAVCPRARNRTRRSRRCRLPRTIAHPRRASLLFEHQHREAFARFEEIPVEGAERKRMRARAARSFRARRSQAFRRSTSCNCTIRLCVPQSMTIARADGEAERGDKIPPPRRDRGRRARCGRDRGAWRSRDASAAVTSPTRTRSAPAAG